MRPEVRGGGSGWRLCTAVEVLHGGSAGRRFGWRLCMAAVLHGGRGSARRFCTMAVRRGGACAWSSSFSMNDSWSCSSFPLQPCRAVR
eukprot:1044628-Prymnesium_polylepis.2